MFEDAKFQEPVGPDVRARVGGTRLEGDKGSGRGGGGT